MERSIQLELQAIEERQRVRIILAVESGSRAWDFASPDSDYDVRFLYIQPAASYLKLERTRDVIERPVNDLLDVNGWDLQKALRLLHTSNPTLFEWFASPIVYRETELAERMKPLLNDYFSPRKALWHYHSMASGNYREHLRQERVRLKKYFYVLRPILACRWILRSRLPIPMRFSDLVEAELDASLRGTVTELLRLKVEAPETERIARVDELNAYIEESLLTLPERIEGERRAPQKGLAPLDAFFLDSLGIAP